ncbi:hypothetical protein NRL37_13090 [Metapseudomonas otitidis]|uniref:hypothetical protein n=1 Tax=Metapseudomonas otitidis TaxID=319939 RepID=UPI00227CF5BA|nr:hypothetical protein [Pseudomonas otitidis]WAF88330.1 hypothetical protein NRL37_13090 [Pseudomonas otitidis]
MEAIADKIRYYRKEIPSPALYTLGSPSLWLAIGLATLIVALLLFDLYLRISQHTYLLENHEQLWITVCEIPMLLGLMQAYFQGIERRYRSINRETKRIHFRTPQGALVKEKLSHLRKIFSHDGDLDALARNLIEEWEWRREIKIRAKDPLILRATGFFKLPSPGNFAGYLTGFMAILAGIVIATLPKEIIFSDAEQLLADAEKLIIQLWLLIAIPIAVCVLPCAVILVGVKQIGEAILERVNDQFLSHMAFYRFILELLELHDRGEELLLRKTRAWAYWSVRLSIAPIKDVPRVWRRIQRAKALARRNVKIWNNIQH